MSANEDHSTKADAEIAELEAEIAELTAKLNAARRTASGPEVPDYAFRTLDGEVRLRQLFAGQGRLLAIHNMGQGCRYCTLWADGVNGFLPHLESAMAVVLLSKDDPETQRRFANARGWRFRLASHGGGAYIRDETVMPGHDNAPGAVVYEKRDGKVFRKNAVVLRPGGSLLLGLELPRPRRPRRRRLDPPVRLLAPPRHPRRRRRQPPRGSLPGSGAGGEEVVHRALEVAEGVAHPRDVAVGEVAEHFRSLPCPRTGAARG